MKAKYAGSADLIRLWSEDGTRVLRQITHYELIHVIGAQQVMWHLDSHGKKLGVRLVFQPRQSSKHSRHVSIPTSASLTHHDSETNGLAAWHEQERKPGLNSHDQRDEMIIGNEVDRVMSKIEAWPIIGDTKAVRVSVRT